MNALPKYRSAVHGRTWGRTWSASDFDPISHYPRAFRAQRALGALLAIAIGAGLAVLIVLEIAQ